MAAYEEEEEEEEEEFWSRRPPARPAAPPAAPLAEMQEEEEVYAPPLTEEELIEDLAGHAHDIWKNIGEPGLRRRLYPEPGTGPAVLGAPLGGSLFADEDFALGSERLPEAPRTTGAGPKPAWHALLLGMLGLGSAMALAILATPGEASFRTMRDVRYGPAYRAEADAQPSDEVSRWLSWLSRDRSFDGHVAWSRYVNHGPFALGNVALSVAGSSAGNAKKSGKRSESQSRKVYEHRYLGMLGLWVPLPYLPQPGQKANTFGVGLCVLSRCICLPDLSKGSKSGGKSGRGCWRFRGGKSAALNVMAIPNGLLFFFWQWPTYWSKLAAHATLSLANLHRGHLWVLLTAPFSHRSWGEIFTSAVLLTNTLDSFDRAGVSFPIFFLLYLGGSWAAWLARGVIWNRLLRGDKNAFYTQECGAAGGLAAQLLFMARARPEEKFQFSMYFIPLPIELRAWQSLLAHGAIAIWSKRRQVEGEVLAHLAAWGFGFIVYDMWKQYI